MLDTFHYITLALYIYIFLLATCNLRNVYKAHNVRALKNWLSVFSVSLMLQTSLFIYLQVDWVVSNHDEDVGDVTSLLWLLFDYFNGFVMLAYAKSIRIYLHWKHNKQVRSMRNRRSDP